MCGPVTAMHFSGSGGWDTRRSARPREHLAAKASQAPAERGHVCHQVRVKLWRLSPGVCKVPREAYETLGRCHPHRSAVCCVPVREAALPPAASLAPAGPARKGEASPPPPIRCLRIGWLSPGQLHTPRFSAMSHWAQGSLGKYRTPYDGWLVAVHSCCLETRVVPNGAGPFCLRCLGRAALGVGTGRGDAVRGGAWCQPWPSACGGTSQEPHGRALHES